MYTFNGIACSRMAAGTALYEQTAGYSVAESMKLQFNSVDK